MIIQRPDVISGEIGPDSNCQLPGLVGLIYSHSRRLGTRVHALSQYQGRLKRSYCLTCWSQPQCVCVCVCVCVFFGSCAINYDGCWWYPSIMGAGLHPSREIWIITASGSALMKWCLMRHPPLRCNSSGRSSSVILEMDHKQYIQKKKKNQEKKNNRTQRNISTTKIIKEREREREEGRKKLPEGVAPPL